MRWLVVLLGGCAVVLIVGLIGLTGQPVMAVDGVRWQETPTPQPGQGTITADARLRKGTDTNAAVVGMLPAGTFVTILAVETGQAITLGSVSSSEWYRVRANTGGDELEGYVWSGLVEVEQMPVYMPAGGGGVLIDPETDPVPQAFGPASIALTQDGQYAYVGFSLAEVVLKVRLDDLAVVGATELYEYFPLACWHIALDASEEKLFVPSDTWRKLFVIDTQSMDVIHVIDDLTITGMVLSQTAPELITWNGGNTVNIINTETYAVREFTDERVGFVHIRESEQGPTHWYVQTGDEQSSIVGLYNTGSKTWDYSIRVPVQEEGEGFHDLVVLPDEQKLYMATIGGWYPEYHAYGWLYAVDLNSQDVSILPIDGGAMALDASPDSRWVYVATAWPLPNNNNLLVVDTQTDAVVEQINLGVSPTGWACTEMDDVALAPAAPETAYAICGDAEALARVNLDARTVEDRLVFNREDIAPHLFVRLPGTPTGYVLVQNSANAYKLNLDESTIEGVVELPHIRDDAYVYDAVIDDQGHMLIAQGESVLEVDSSDMSLIASHDLPPDIPSVWRFTLSPDQTKLFSVSQARGAEQYQPDTLLVIDRADYQVVTSLHLDGGAFNERPYALPGGSKLYVLGGWQNAAVSVHVIETEQYTLHTTITFDDPARPGISAGPYYPFAYDPGSHTLYVGATYVVLGINTDTDTITQVINLEDSARALGLEPWQLTYINAVGLVYQPQENSLYIAHLDRSYVSVYDLNAGQFLPLAIGVQGSFPACVFANDDASTIYALNVRSDNITGIDVASKTVDTVIDLHAHR
ncbi:MAG: SH3 domain-containing protein [Anaerolineae bacterium]|nr:SH3 domain-containing protein [Anaerolineae bacterium]